MTLPHVGWDYLAVPGHHLPPHLLELEVVGGGRSSGGSRTFHPPWWALQHVNALTRLSMAGMRVNGEALNASLHALEVADVEDAAPLLRLTALTELRLLCMFANVAQLVPLRALAGGLCCFHVCVPAEDMCFPETAEAAPEYNAPLGTIVARAAAALANLHVNTDNQELDAECLAHLGACSRLTALNLHSCAMACQRTATRLSSWRPRALARMTALQRVSITDWWMGQCPSVAGKAAVAQVLAALRRLTKCKLSGMPLGPALAAFAGARQLTSLDVCGCGLDDGAAAALTFQDGGGPPAGALRELCLQHNPQVTDACLAGLDAAPPLALTRLELAWSITLGAVQRLSAALPQLLVLHKGEQRVAGTQVAGS